MPQALITVNGTPGSNTALPINTLVQLNNQGVGGELTYFWQVVDQPPSNTAALSSAVIQNPTFTPLEEGTYLLRLIVNLGMPNEVRNTVVCAVRQMKTLNELRVPAAGETVEASTSEGWAEDVNAYLRALDTTQANAACYTAVLGAGVPAVGTVVRVSGRTILKNGLPGQENVPTVDAALATVAANVDTQLGVVELAASGPYAAGTLVRVRTAGLVAAALAGAVLQDSVYVDDTGALSLTAGTVSRRVGRVATVLSPTAVLVDFHAPAANLSAGGGGAPAAFQWQPGGTPDPGHGVYTTWASLYTAVSAAPLEARTVRVDGSYAATTIPAGAWDLSGWNFVGPQWIAGNLVIAPGATFDLAAAAASPWAPLENVFKLSFTDIYVDFGAGSPTATPFIDLTLYGGWNFDLRLVRAEVDSYSGAAFIASNAGGNIYVILDGSAMVGSPGTDNVLRVDGGAQIVGYAYAASYVSNWASGNGTAQITRYAASTISAPVAPEFTGTFVLVENDYRPIFYSPGYATPDSGYATWQDLYNYVSGLPLNVRKRVHIDPTWAQAYVTPGTWDLSNWEFVGRSRDLTSLTIMNGATITVADGASLSFERMGLITNQSAGPAIVVAPTSYAYLYFRECAVTTNTVQPLVRDTGGTGFFIAQATDTQLNTAMGGAVIDFGNTLTGGFLTSRGTTEYTTADVLASGVGITNVTIRNEGMVTAWTPQANLLGPTTYSDLFAQSLRYSIAGATNENIPATVGTPEYTVGGFAYNPMTSLGRDGFPTFEAMALTAAVSSVVNFYDIGAPGALAAPTLVASILVLATQGRAQQLVSVNAGGPALNTIFNGERLYEIRVVSNATNSILLYWAGIKLN